MPVLPQLLWWSESIDQRAAWWQAHRSRTFAVKCTTPEKMAKMIEASKQLRRVNGRLHLPTLASRSMSTSPRNMSVPSVMMTT
jgi:hypothetical protein